MPQPSLCVQCTFLLNGSAWIKEKNYLVKRFKIVCKIESNIFWFVNLSKNWFQKCIVEHLIFWKSLIEKKNPMKCYSSNSLLSGTFIIWLHLYTISRAVNMVVFRSYLWILITIFFIFNQWMRCYYEPEFKSLDNRVTPS